MGLPLSAPHLSYGGIDVEGREIAVRRVASTRMPTRWGMFEADGYEQTCADGKVETALVISLGDLRRSAPLLRIHSQCFTGEILGSMRCDCGDQLTLAMQAIANEGRGLVIYEYQEGRGIGLMAKLRAYEMQDAGLDTIQANQALGYMADCRDLQSSDRYIARAQDNPRETSIKQYRQGAGLVTCGH